MWRYFNFPFEYAKVVTTLSRARPFIDPLTKEETWFDQRARASAAQLELLADWSDESIDDLLDAGLTARQVLFKLREVATPGVIPELVLERRRERERVHGLAPACRICQLNGWECEGRITRHHFVPRWIMLQLENYQAYAARSACTIPICVGRHRDLHFRGENDGPKTIIPYLREHERKFAQKMIDELRAEHPKIFDLLSSGTEESYEGTLIRDYLSGAFTHIESIYSEEEYPVQKNQAVGD